MKKNSSNRELVVLVVEDDPILAEIFAIAFQLAGFKSIVSRDGIEAMRLIKEMRPDVILLDLHLPKVMGDDIFAKLQKEPALLNAITILATGDSRRASFLQNQVDFVFLKPISFSQLRHLATRIYTAASEKPILPDQDTGPLHSGKGAL